MTRVAHLAALSLLIVCGVGRGARATPVLSAEPPRAGSDIPPCRISAVPAAVVRMAEIAFRAVGEFQPLSYSGVSTKGEPGFLHLISVKDALRDEVDAENCLCVETSAVASSALEMPPTNPGTLDTWSVQGVCAAEPGRVRCSEAALAFLVDKEGSRDGLSPTLLYVLAHEFAHIAYHHETGQWNDNAIKVSAGSDSDLVAALARGCSRDREMLKLETAADDLALKAVVRAFERAPFATAEVKSHYAVLTHSERLYQGLGSLTQWLARTLGQTAGHSGAGARVCELVVNSAAGVDVPFYGGGHPRRWARAAGIVRTAYERAAWDEDGKRREDLGALPMNLLTGTVTAKAQEAQVAEFCTQVYAYEAGEINCATHTPGDGIYQVPADGFEDGDRQKFKPITLVLEPLQSSSRNEATAKNTEGYAVFVKARFYETYRDSEKAATAQHEMAERATKLYSALSHIVGSDGAVWIYETHSDTEIRDSALGFDEYAVSFEAVSILKSATRIEPDALRSAANDGVLIENVAWADARYEAILHFFDAGSTPEENELLAAKRADTKRVLSKKLGLDAVFDLSRCAAGTRNAMAPGFMDLIGFVKERLDTRFKRQYTLAEPGDPQPPFYLATRNQQFSDNLYLPFGWIAAAETDAKPTLNDSQLAGWISRAYDTDSRQFSDAELAAMFGDDAGETSLGACRT